MLAELYDFGNLNVPGVQAGVDCNLTGAIKTLRRQRMGAASAGWSFLSQVKLKVASFLGGQRMCSFNERRQRMYKKAKV
jgi:hypothetical protein